MTDLRYLFDVNFFGLVDLTQKCLPHMQAQAWGRVINISSMGGLFCTPFNSAYSSAKFALESWSRTLKQEVKKFGVEVSLIRPGCGKERDIRQCCQQDGRGTRMGRGVAGSIFKFPE